MKLLSRAQPCASWLAVKIDIDTAVALQIAHPPLPIRALKLDMLARDGGVRQDDVASHEQSHADVLNGLEDGGLCVDSLDRDTKSLRRIGVEVEEGRAHDDDLPRTDEDRLDGG